MTHIYAYIKEGCGEEKIQNLIAGIKAAACEGFNLSESASTVAVKELPEACRSENFGVLALVYTAKGKGFDIKKRFAKKFDDAVREALGDAGEVKLIIKEQASDMTGINGVLRCNARETVSAYEEN